MNKPPTPRQQAQTSSTGAATNTVAAPFHASAPERPGRIKIATGLDGGTLRRAARFLRETATYSPNVPACDIKGFRALADMIDSMAPTTGSEG